MRQNRTPRTDDAPSGVCRLRIHTVSINNKPHVVFPPRQTLEAATCKQSKTRLSRSGAGADRRALFTSLIVLVTLVFVSRTTLAPRLLCCNYLSNTPMGFMLHLIWINHRGQLSFLPVLLEGLITEPNFVPYSRRKTWQNTTEQNLPAIMRCQHFYFLSQSLQHLIIVSFSATLQPTHNEQGRRRDECFHKR